MLLKSFAPFDSFVIDAFDGMLAFFQRRGATIPVLMSMLFLTTIIAILLIISILVSFETSKFQVHGDVVLMLSTAFMSLSVIKLSRYSHLWRMDSAIRYNKLVKIERAHFRSFRSIIWVGITLAVLCLASSTLYYVPYDKKALMSMFLVFLVHQVIVSYAFCAIPRGSNVGMSASKSLAT